MCSSVHELYETELNAHIDINAIHETECSFFLFVFISKCCKARFFISSAAKPWCLITDGKKSAPFAFLCEKFLR